MKDRIRNFLHYCETVDFGKVELSTMESTFCQRFNNEILSLCKTLPQCIQSDSMLFLMQYSGLSLGDKLNFFSNYYSPTWSVLYWLSRNGSLPAGRLKIEHVKSAITAQSMAMFLHSLDDHLSDRQIPVSPLTLLLRNRAWTIMDRAFLDLADSIPAGKGIIRHFMDEYYSGIQSPNGLKSLDSYCDLFKRQMAIGMIAPTLLSLKINGSSVFTRKLQIAYRSFGIAWRLLDDIRDLGRDIEKGVKSSVYFSLPGRVRILWKNNVRTTRAVGKAVTQTILIHILKNSLIDKIRKRICSELETAASIVEALKMIGLAREFRCLALPLRSRGSALEEHDGKSSIFPARI